MNDKLVKIQKTLKAPKSNFNAFAKFNYRSAEDILEAVKPLVHKEGLTLMLSDEVVNVGESNYVKAVVILTDGENVVEAQAFAREEPTKKGMDAAQITGSASSYARKYALSGLFAIDDGKDADGQDNTDHVSERTSFTPMNSLVKVDQVKQLLEAAKKASGLADREEILTWFRETVDMEPTQVKQIEFDNVLRWIEEEHV